MGVLLIVFMLSPLDSFEVLNQIKVPKTIEYTIYYEKRKKKSTITELEAEREAIIFLANN